MGAARQGIRATGRGGRLPTQPQHTNHSNKGHVAPLGAGGVARFHGVTGRGPTGVKQVVVMKAYVGKHGECDEPR